MRRARAKPEETPEQVAADTFNRACIAARWLKCDHLVAAFDSKTSWRWQTDSTYKAKSAGDSRRYTVAGVRTWAAHGIKCIGAEGFEADDLIATLAARGAGRGRHVKTLSSDNDLFQLSSIAFVYQYAPLGESSWLVLRDQCYVQERFGVLPCQYADFLALVGGKNNVEGMAGVGAKRAAKLLQAHKTFAGILDAAPVDLPTPEQRKRLELGLRLLTLRTDVPITALEPAECTVPDEKL